MTSEDYEAYNKDLKYPEGCECRVCQGWPIPITQKELDHHHRGLEAFRKMDKYIKEHGEFPPNG